MKVFILWQDNEGATFKDYQDNRRAILQKDMIIKDMVIINEDTELSKKIKEFSENREWNECTLTNFYEWLKKEIKRDMTMKDEVKCNCCKEGTGVFRHNKHALHSIGLICKKCLK